MPAYTKSLVGEGLEVIIMRRIIKGEADFAPFYHRLIAHSCVLLNFGAERFRRESRDARILLWRCYLDGDVTPMRDTVAKIDRLEKNRKITEAVLKSPVRKTTEMRMAG